MSKYTKKRKKSNRIELYNSRTGRWESIENVPSYYTSKSDLKRMEVDSSSDYMSTSSWDSCSNSGSSYSGSSSWSDSSSSSSFD